LGRSIGPLDTIPLPPPLPPPTAGAGGAGGAGGATGTTDATGAAGLGERPLPILGRTSVLLLPSAFGGGIAGVARIASSSFCFVSRSLIQAEYRRPALETIVVGQNEEGTLIKWCEYLNRNETGSARLTSSFSLQDRKTLFVRGLQLTNGGRGNEGPGTFAC
jgi:hypothetical protein